MHCRRVAILLVLAALVQGRKDYTGYYSLSVGPIQTRQQAQALQSLVDREALERKVILLQDKYVSGKSVDLVVSRDRMDLVTSVLNQENIAVDIMHDNLQSIIDDVDHLNKQARDRFYRNKASNPDSRDAPDFYMDYTEMEAWMVQIVGNASDIAVLTNIGKSYEDRDLWIIEVNKDSNLPAIFVDSGIHAREYIAHATNVWIINEILVGTSDDAVRMRENYRWYFMPCVNPDGYEYTWNGDRLWRKNRQPNENTVCVGTDLNRNWAAIDYDNSDCQPNIQPCSDTYSGPSPFSGPESAALSNAMLERSEVTELSLALHCYSQLWLIPWGGLTEKPSDYDELLAVANAAITAIEAENGLEFVAGTPIDLLYCAAGGSFDWVKNGDPLAYNSTGAAIKYAYGPELRPASQADGGFIVPPENIYPSGREIFAGLVASVDTLFPPQQ